jgi:SAM-dependent methyltransferase
MAAGDRTADAIKLDSDGTSQEIYQRPADYDLEHEGDDRDVRFYRRLVSRFGAGRVLELACGSGRVTLPLAAGLTGADAGVVGVELGEEMLREARRKLAEAPAEVQRRVRLEAGDMCTWRSPDRFDLVIVACSSITHLQTVDEQLALWRTAFEQLRPGGRFALDITLPDFAAYADSLRTPPRALVEIDLDQSNAQGERLVRQRTTRFDTIDQRADITLLYDRFAEGRHVDRYISDFTAHVYFPRELQLLFRLGGFEVEAIWADYQFQRPGATTREVCMLGRRPAT